jgi:hypothetical protein
MMKNFMLPAFAMGVVLAVIPTAVADSFGYGASRSNVTANLALDAGHADFANGVGGFSAYTSGGIPAASAMLNGASVNLGANGLRQSADAGYTFDNLLNKSNAADGIVQRGGVLVDLSGNELNLLFGNFSGSKNARPQGNGHILLAEKISSRSNGEIPKSSGALAGEAATLTATPEPGSLFLLGTGLLFMALVLFRKASKRPTSSDAEQSAH